MRMCMGECIHLYKDGCKRVSLRCCANLHHYYYHHTHFLPLHYFSGTIMNKVLAEAAKVLYSHQTILTQTCSLQCVLAA